MPNRHTCAARGCRAGRCCQPRERGVPRGDGGDGSHLASSRALPGTSRARAQAHSEHAAMVAELRGVFGTLTYPHLILPYSAYYGHLESHYGGSWCSPTAWWCDKKHLHVPEPPIYGKMRSLPRSLPVFSVLTIDSLYKAASIRIFKFV